MTDLAADGAVVQIEVWSDVVCPWCYIGKRRLDAAVASQAQPVRITHRAFQLDPVAISDGQLTIDLLAGKYQISREQAAQMMSDVSEVAAGIGLQYRLEQTVRGNTRDAHRCILWAQGHGQGPALLEALYAGYFTEARPVFTAEELMPFITGIGLDASAAQAMLASDAYLDQVRSDQELAASFGANGVPFFVFNRAYAISGAQPASVFEATLARARGSA